MPIDSLRDLQPNRLTAERSSWLSVGWLSVGWLRIERLRIERLRIESLRSGWLRSRWLRLGEPRVGKGPVGSRNAPWAAVLSPFCCLALAACMRFVPVVEEPLRVGNVADLTAEDLGLRPGVTTFEQARALLGARGMTGIVEDVYADPTGTTTSALGAEYQTRVHLFTDGRYERTLTLPTHGLPPYGVALRLGVDGSAHVLLVLYRDPLARDAEPPTLMSFRLREHDIELASRTTFETTTSENGGMTRPMLLGTDLGEGVMLVARDRSGVIWDKSYLLRTEGDRLTITGQPMMNAIRCNCVRRYTMGDAAH